MACKTSHRPQDQQQDNTDPHSMTAPKTDSRNFFLVPVGQKNHKKGQ
jgi:hypothetical protein